MIVFGNYGVLEVDDLTGLVSEYHPEPREDPEYADIAQFDLVERREWYAKHGVTLKYPQPDADVLDVGFWTNTGEYVPAELEYRLMILREQYDIGAAA